MRRRAKIKLNIFVILYAENASQTHQSIRYLTDFNVWNAIIYLKMIFPTLIYAKLNEIFIFDDSAYRVEQSSKFWADFDE